jgi:ABC-2 type transport system permease protein
MRNLNVEAHQRALALPRLDLELAVFSRVAKIDEKNYSLFLLSGIMVWTFFQQSVEQGLNSIVSHGSLLQKIYIPKLVFPISLVISNLVNLAFFLMAYFIMASFTDVGVPMTAPFIIPVLAMLILLTTAVTILMAILTVFFRDLSHLTTILLRALFYLTPVIYPPSAFGERAEQILKLNPLYYPILGARDAIYYGNIPHVENWNFGLAIGTALLVAALFLFSRVDHKITYYV